MLAMDNKAARITWTCAAVLLSIYALYIVRKTILLFVLALMFAHLLSPLVALLDRKLKLRNRTLALALPFAMILTLLGGAVIALRAPVMDQARELQKQVLGDTFRNNLGHVELFGLPLGSEIVNGEALKPVQTHLMSMMPALGRGVGRASRDIANFFIVPILAFFMLKDEHRICQAVLSFFFHPSGKAEACRYRRVVETVCKDAYVLIVQYMQSLLLLCFAVLIVFSVVLRVMEVPYWLLLSLLAFVLEFVPLIGPLVSGILILGVCEMNQYPHLGFVFVFLIAFRIFQDYVLSPKLMEKTVKLHPLAVIFGVFAGGEIANIPGIFLSVPLLAVARLAFCEYQKMRAGDLPLLEPATSEPVRAEVASSLESAPRLDPVPSMEAVSCRANSQEDICVTALVA